MRPLAVMFLIAALLGGVACRSGDSPSDSPLTLNAAPSNDEDSSFRNLGKRGESEG